MEALSAAGTFRQPDLDDVERSFALALTHAASRGRLFVDCWDLDRFASCASCLPARRKRLCEMNLEQRILPAWSCRQCTAATQS
jgi:hypothetical protein